MLIAHITDTHVMEPGMLAFGRIDTGARLAACVARLNGLEPLPDVVVATGDLVDKGTAAEYRHLRSILAQLKPRLFVIPGNHDLRENLRGAFSADGYLPAEGHLNYTVEDFPVRLVAADSVVEGEAGGLLDGPQFAWLETRLAEDRTRPTILLMHHPPFATGIVHMDHMNCTGAAELAALISRNPQVERVLCGHVHRAVQNRFAGTIAMIAPSTAFQVALDLDPAASAHWTDEPTGFALHRWSDRDGMSSHLCTVADPGPKRPFHGPGQ